MAGNAFHPRGRLALVLVPAGAFLAIGACALVASAEPPPAADPALRATLTCDRVSEPGRVRCAVEARVAEGRTLAWADVEILELPELASPLKARIGPADATSRQPTSAAWAFAVVARRVGQGEARVRVRAVTCTAPAGDAGATGARCSPVTTEVRAQIVVGG